MKLPVLMYHDISNDREPDFLTVHVEQLNKQFQHLKSRGYTAISFTQLQNFIDGKSGLPEKPLLISFDDGYYSNYKWLLPLLEKYDLCAVIFLVAQFACSTADAGKYIKPDILKKIPSKRIEFGYHSFNHKSYNDLSIEEIDIDLRLMKEMFHEHAIPIKPFFAYTYGALPKKDPIKMGQLEKLFKKYDIKAAFRIGNRINHLPFNEVFKIQRIDVRGTDSLFRFKLMLRFGRKWIP